MVRPDDFPVATPKNTFLGHPAGGRSATPWGGHILAMLFSMIFNQIELSFKTQAIQNLFFGANKTVLGPTQRGSQPQKSRFPAADVFFRHFGGARSGR
jgi:hypothetical protein